jgi:hypothetical protein
MVDFIDPGLHAGQRRQGPWQRRQPHAGGHGLVGREQGRQRQKAQAGCVAVHAVQVDQRLAQHLQAAADAQHLPARRRMGGDGSIQALGRIQARSAAVALEPGRMIQSAPASWAGVRAQTTQAGHLQQGLEFVEVADARVGDDGDGGVHGAAPPPEPRSSNTPSSSGRPCWNCMGWWPRWARRCAPAASWGGASRRHRPGIC